MVFMASSFTATAEPYIPADDAVVLERLTSRSNDPAVREISELRRALAQQPDDIDRALQLAWRYLQQARAEADPRYYGYIEATLAPWWKEIPPVEVLLMRAAVHEARHEFGPALAMLDQLLARQPRHRQAWLNRSVILRVQGDYQGAFASCVALQRLSQVVLAQACRASILSLTGQGQAAYQQLQQLLLRYPNRAVEERLWVLAMLAEIAQRLGRVERAEHHFQAALALGQRDAYLLGAYADFLLEQQRPREVRDLLQDEIRADGLLLRLTLAEQRLGLKSFERHTEMLQERIVATRLRGGVTHLGLSAPFALHILKQPHLALQDALENWALQKEPRDALMVLQAALGANKPTAAQPVLEWLERTSLEDVRLNPLVRKIKDSIVAKERKS